MLSFTTEDYEFEADGKTYSIPEMTIDDFAGIAKLYEIKDPIKQVIAYRDTLMNVAPEDTKAVLQKMAFRKITKLFADWTGIKGTSGE